MDKVTIADNLFLQYGKSFSIGGDNAGVGPTYFEWELADPQSARFVTDSFLKDAKGTGQVALLLESFFLHPENYLAAMGKPFDYVLTSNRYFAENRSWLWHPHGGSWIDFNLWGMNEKKKNISLIRSEKKSMRGHQLRHEIAERFGNLITDTYGYDNKIIRKFDGVAPYRFSVIIENEKAPGYFTEKLIDCFSVGTIPIYWGCTDLERFFDLDGVVEVESFEDVNKAIESSNDRAYKTFLKSAKVNLELAKNYRIGEDWIYQNYPFLFRS